MNRDEIFTAWIEIVKATADDLRDRNRRIDELVEREGGLVDTGEIVFDDNSVSVLSHDLFSVYVGSEPVVRLPAVWITSASLTPLPVF